MSAEAAKWLFKMEWCRQKRYPPAQEMYWNMAEEAWEARENKYQAQTVEARHRYKEQ
jgi:hypothetical protein